VEVSGLEAEPRWGVPSGSVQRRVGGGCRGSMARCRLLPLGSAVQMTGRELPERPLGCSAPIGTSIWDCHLDFCGGSQSGRPGQGSTSQDQRRRNSTLAKDEEDVLANVLPTIFGPSQASHPSARNIIFGNLEPLTDGTIAPAKPSSGWKPSRRGTKKNTRQYTQHQNARYM
jgi:hypothetical protein